jgi:hypothetical protein
MPICGQVNVIFPCFGWSAAYTPQQWVFYQLLLLAELELFELEDVEVESLEEG